MVQNFAFGKFFPRARVIPMNNAVKIILSNLGKFKFHPGQMIYLRILRVSPLQSHPFEISWWQEDEHGYATSVSLLIKTRGGFTKDLLRYAASGELLACIDGPYGNPLDLGGYGCIMMFATGIGIAAHIPYIKDILNKRKRWMSPARSISLAWEIDKTGKANSS